MYHYDIIYYRTTGISYALLLSVPCCVRNMIITARGKRAKYNYYSRSVHVVSRVGDGLTTENTFFISTARASNGELNESATRVIFPGHPDPYYRRGWDRRCSVGGDSRDREERHVFSRRALVSDPPGAHRHRRRPGIRHHVGLAG